MNYPTSSPTSFVPQDEAIAAFLESDTLAELRFDRFLTDNPTYASPWA